MVPYWIISYMAKRIMLVGLAYREKLDVWTFWIKENKMSTAELADEGLR